MDFRSLRMSQKAPEGDIYKTLILCGRFRHSRIRDRRDYSTICFYDSHYNIPCEFSRCAKEETDLSLITNSDSLVFIPNWSYVPPVSNTGRMLDGYLEICAPIIVWNASRPAEMRRNVSASPPAPQPSSDIHFIELGELHAISVSKRVGRSKIASNTRFETDAVLVGISGSEQTSSAAPGRIAVLLFQDIGGSTVVPLYCPEPQGSIWSSSTLIEASYHLSGLQLVRSGSPPYFSVGFQADSLFSMRLLHLPTITNAPIRSVSAFPGVATVDGVVISKIRDNTFRLAVDSGTCLVFLHHAVMLPYLCGTRIGAKIRLHNVHIIYRRCQQVQSILLCSISRCEVLSFSAYDKSRGVAAVVKSGSSDTPSPFRNIYRSLSIACEFDARFRGIVGKRFLRVDAAPAESVFKFVSSLNPDWLLEPEISDTTVQGSNCFLQHSYQCDVASELPEDHILSPSDLFGHPEIQKLQCQLRKEAESTTNILEYRILGLSSLFDRSDSTFLAQFSGDSTHCSRVSLRTSTFFKDSIDCVAALMLDQTAVIPLESICGIKMSARLVLEAVVDSVSKSNFDSPILMYLVCENDDVEPWSCFPEQPGVPVSDTCTAHVASIGAVQLNKETQKYECCCSTDEGVAIKLPEPFTGQAMILREGQLHTFEGCWDRSTFVARKVSNVSQTSTKKPDFSSPRDILSNLTAQDDIDVSGIILDRTFEHYPDETDIKCVIGKAKLKVILRSHHTADMINLFVDLQLVAFPLGLLPGAVVKIYSCQVILPASNRPYLCATDRTRFVTTEVTARIPHLFGPSCRLYHRYFADFDENQDRRSWYFQGYFHQLIELQLEWRCPFCSNCTDLSHTDYFGVSAQGKIEFDDGSSEARVSLNSLKLLLQILGISEPSFESGLHFSIRRHGLVRISKGRFNFSERGMFSEDQALVRIEEALCQAEGCLFELWAKHFPRAQDADFSQQKLQFDLLHVQRFVRARSTAWAEIPRPTGRPINKSH
jgi:hypothetical protein